MDRSELLGVLDEMFSIPDYPDFSGAWNGVQLEMPAEVNTIATAVDACAATSAAAAAVDADLLLVHHGMLWDGVRPITGAYFATIEPLIVGGCGLYSIHLPLDAHEIFGNNAIIANAMGVTERVPFGDYKGSAIGWLGTTSVQTATDAGKALGYDVVEAVEPSAPVSRIAIVSGSGGSTLDEAVAVGADVLLTGEVDHHARVAARDRGIGIWLGGHYQTETAGVRALGDHLANEFGITHAPLDLPTGG